tara:strand:- start:128 stop:304 length:177 start_codon:yes stop_codon:yes gene_type:complete
MIGVVEKIEEEGETYLRTKSSGLIYDAKCLSNPIVVGIWNRVIGKIDFNYVEKDVEEE